MKFQARISKMGTRYIINIPQALYPQIEDLQPDQDLFLIILEKMAKTTEEKYCVRTGLKIDDTPDKAKSLKR